MRKAVQIRMGGYGPPTTSFSLGLKRIGDRLEAAFGDEVEVRYVWNIMDFGYRAEDILWLVESGMLTLGYQSSSYLTDRVPELGILDLPFVFSDREAVREAMDRRLGEALTRKIEDRVNYRIFGYFENGFRHLSNRLRPIHAPSDMTGMAIRVLPSPVHQSTFELLGADARRMDLTEAIRGIMDGTIDAQENPLANTVTYGVHAYHRFHTLTSHFYLSRPIFVHRPTVEGWPAEFRSAMEDAVREAVTYQRALAIEEERDAERTIRDAGCEIVELSAAERLAFVEAVAPLLTDAQAEYGADMLKLLPG